MFQSLQQIQTLFDAEWHTPKDMSNATSVHQPPSEPEDPNIGLDIGFGRKKYKSNPYDLIHQKGHEGKFTSQFKSRRPQHRHIQSLSDFAHYILQNPQEFNKISHQRANYYVNLIEKSSNKLKGGNMRNIMYKIYDYLNPAMSHDEFFERMKTRIKSEADANALAQKISADKMLQKARIALQKAEQEHGNIQKTSEALRKRQHEIAEHIGVFEILGYTEVAEARREVNDLAARQADEPDYEHITSWGLGRPTIKRLHKCHKLCGGKLSVREFETMIKESYKSESDRDRHIGDYVLDPELSTYETAVYHNPKTGETKVAYKGTANTLRDWGNNALYALGFHNKTNRFDRAKKVQEAVEKKYGTEKLDVLAHSQSGAFAQEIGKNAKNVIALNPATHPFYKPEGKNATVLKATGDIVSKLNYLNPFAKKQPHISIPSTRNPVSAHLPSVLENLDPEMILGNGRGDHLNKFFSWLKNRNAISKLYAKNSKFKVASKETINKLQNEMEEYKKRMFGGKKPHKKLKLLFE